MGKDRHSPNQWKTVMGPSDPRQGPPWKRSIPTKSDNQKLQAKKKGGKK